MGSGLQLIKENMMKYLNFLRLLPEGIALAVVAILDKRYHFSTVNALMTFMIVAVYVRTIMQEIDVVVE